MCNAYWHDANRQLAMSLGVELMNYILFIIIAILTVALVLGISARKGTVDCGNKLKIYKSCGDDLVIPFSGISLGMLTIFCFASAIALQISLYKNTSVVNFVKLYGLFVIIFTAAVIDAKRKIIPNILIILGMSFRLIIYVYEVINVENIKEILVNDLIGFCIGFVFLALVSLLSKGALGFGDVKLFGVIGITSGSYCTYSTLLVSLIISVIVSLIKIGRKKMGRKDSFPFGPCIAIGYIIVILLTSY